MVKFATSTSSQKPTGREGLPKRPVDRAIVKRAGLVGDLNRWRHKEAHDDAAMAVRLMPIETIQELNGEGWPIKPENNGENFTTAGIPYDAFVAQARYRIGTTVLIITKACDPCSNLHHPLRGQGHVKTIYQRRGWYASVEQEGEVLKGDAIEQLGRS